MTSTSNLTGLPPGVDVASIVAEVLRRVRADSGGSSGSSLNLGSSFLVSDKVISVSTVEAIPSEVESIRVACGIITPAARDELRVRGITIERDQTQPATQTRTNTPANRRFLQIHGDTDSHDAIVRQLTTRGIAHCPDASRRVVIAQRPALALIEQIQSHRIAVLIHCLADIERYAAEVAPDTFVIDAKHFHWIGVINAIAAIARLPKLTEAIR